MTTTIRTRNNHGRAGRIGLSLAAASAVVATLIGPAAGSASAGLPLGNQATITQTGLDVGGTWAELRWTANVSSTVVETAPTPPQQVNGKWQFAYSHTTQTVQKQNGGFKYLALPLSTDTTYYVVLTTPATGNLASTQVKGQFRTKARTNTRVTFDEIHVISDADSGLKGEGDLWWFFDTSFSQWSNGWNRPADSGDTFAVAPTGHPGYAISGWGSTAPSVTVTVQGAEDDVWGYGDWACGLMSSSHPWSGEPSQESNDCYETAFAQAEVKFPTHYFEGNEVPFTATVGRSPALQFTVTGTIQATYA